MSAAPSRPMAAGSVARSLLADNSLTVAAVIQLVAGVITTKLAATLLGPVGVGAYALVQAVANIVALCALGTGEALVREWGRSQSHLRPLPPRQQSYRFDAMLRGAELAGLASLTVVAVAAVAWSGPLSRMVFGEGRREMFLLAVAAGITFGWVTLQVNSMVARRRVGRVSLALALAAASTPVVALVGFRSWDVAGIGRVHLLAMLASLVTTGLVVSRADASRLGTKRPTGSVSVRAALAEVPALLRYGVPHVLGTLFTASMLLIVPLVVAAGQGVDGAGFYRAAATVAAGMATLFTFELNGDFAARIAGAAGERQTYNHTMRAQLRRLTVRGVVVVATLSLAAPVIVPLLYDRGFDPTTRMLPMILVGQLLGLVALTLNIGVGARHGGGRMLLNAAMGGTATVVAVAVVDTLALVGVAFVGGQTVFLLVCVASTLIGGRRRPIG